MFIFGERFKQLRKEKDLTQEKLAKMFHLNKSSISRYEKGQQIPETETLKNFAEYFGVSIDYLLGRTNERSVVLPVKHEFLPRLKPKDEKHIEKVIESIVNYLEEKPGLMLDGEITSEEDIELLTTAIKNSLEYLKISKKKKDMHPKC